MAGKTLQTRGTHNVFGLAQNPPEILHIFPHVTQNSFVVFVFFSTIYLNTMHFIYLNQKLKLSFYVPKHILYNFPSCLAF